MSNTTYRAFPEKLGASDPTKFVGDKGELFWDPDNGNMSLSDGMTPGGIGIKTRNLEALESNRDASQWVTIFGNTASDWKAYYASGSAVDSNGYLWVVGGYEGVGHRGTLSIFNQEGQLQYNERFVSTDGNSDYQFGEAISIHKDPENGDSIYVVLTTEDNIDEIVLAKLDDSANIVWTREIDGSDSERAVDVITDADGYVYVCGHTRSDGAGGRDGFIARFNPDGTCEWKQTFGGADWDRTESLAVDESYLYVSGQTASSGQGGSDIFVAKLTKGSNTEQPTVVWQKTIGRPASGSWEWGWGIVVGTSGNVYVTGESYDPEYNNNHTIYLAKLSSAGALVWQKYLADYAFSYGAALSLDAAENVYLSGYTWVNYPEAEQQFVPQYNELIIAKFSSVGELKYVKSFGTKYDDSIYYNYGHRSITADGDYIYISGYTYDVSRSNPNGFFARFRADGEFDGVYGDFVAQNILFTSGDSNLVLADSDLILQNAPNISSTNPDNIYVEPYGPVDVRTSIRSPFEVRVRGVLAADTTITRDLSVNGFPFTNTDGSYNNLCAGEGAGSNHQSAYDNIYLGRLSGFRNQYGDQNVYIGTYAGNRNINGHNVFIGYHAGLYSTGGNNVFIGAYAGDGQHTGVDNVVIGYGTNLDDTDASTQLKIGSNGNYWLRGDSARSVYIKTNLVFDSNGTQIVMKSPNGTQYILSVTDSGALQVGINTVQYI
jgi:hypothetical protein